MAAKLHCMALTRGSSLTEAIPDPVIFASMLLDPTKFTPDLAEWKKEHNRTMPRLMQAYSKHRPEISDAITAVSYTHLTLPTIYSV